MPDDVVLPENPAFRPPDMDQKEELRSSLNRLNEKAEAAYAAAEAVLRSLPVFGDALTEGTVSDVRTVYANVGSGIEIVSGAIAAKVASPLDFSSGSISINASLITVLGSLSSSTQIVLRSGTSLRYATAANIRAAMLPVQTVANTTTTVSLFNTTRLEDGGGGLTGDVPRLDHENNRIILNNNFSNIYTSITSLQSQISALRTALNTLGLIAP